MVRSGCLPLACLSVRESPVHGRGVFAAQDVSAGTIVIEYLGERVSVEEARRREAAGTGDYLIWSTEFTLIDGAVLGNAARFVNHSCAPNCTVFRADGRVFFITSRGIARAEELFIDYAFDATDEFAPCACGAPGCRGSLNVAMGKERKDGMAVNLAPKGSFRGTAS